MGAKGERPARVNTVSTDFIYCPYGRTWLWAKARGWFVVVFTSCLRACVSSLAECCPWLFTFDNLHWERQSGQTLEGNTWPSPCPPCYGIDRELQACVNVSVVVCGFVFGRVCVWLVTDEPLRCCRCPCCQRMTAGARLDPSCWPRWTSAWGAVWQRSSSLELKTSPRVSTCSLPFLLPSCSSTCPPLQGRHHSSVIYLLVLLDVIFVLFCLFCKEKL